VGSIKIFDTFGVQ